MSNKEFPNCKTLRYSKDKYVVNDTYFIKHLWSGTWDESEIPETIQKKKKLIEFIKNDPRNENGKFFCEIYDDVFLHYRAGGNWRNEGIEFHTMLTKQLKNILLDPEF